MTHYMTRRFDHESITFQLLDGDPTDTTPEAIREARLKMFATAKQCLAMKLVTEAELVSWDIPVPIEPCTTCNGTGRHEIPSFSAAAFSGSPVYIDCEECFATGCDW